jgi:2,3-bisphosphoglycerate-dependent phosphoglycerate mutase
MVAMDDRAGHSEAVTAAHRSLERAFLIGVPGATEVWLVRHGDCYEGMTSEDDPPLSWVGREQARRLAERVNRAGYESVYTSPLRRAHQTAAAITDRPVVDERLVEASVELANGRMQVTDELDQVRERMRAAVDDVVARHPGGRAIVVGHGISIMLYVCGVLGVEFGSLRLLPFYTCVTVLRALGERRMIGSLVDVAHLEGPGD